MSTFQRNEQSMVDTPAWALEKIREAKEKKLATLHLSVAYNDSREKLTKLPDEIFELSWLTALGLSGNGLRTLPESITRLQNLTTLDLSDNELNTLPVSITKLQNLISLNLNYNRLHTLPEWIGQLQSLISLNLNYNKLSPLPESIAQLQNLVSLNLNLNQLSALPEWIGQLQNLTSLDLNGNRLRTLPESIGQLQNLTSLNLNYNRLRTLPESIGQLQNLTSLNLNFNELRTLPESIGQLQNLTSLGLSGNPLVSPPTEIAERGIGAIREYLRQLGQEGMDYLYEAKLLILGEGGAGKTTLANKLLNTNYKLREEKTTSGVDVLKWSFSVEGDRQFRANIWDFGGQEIYHATHQFFLTRRSLYALVADTRKEDTDFYYWLNIAELLSDGSPLLIVKNEKQDRHREINERALKGQFDSLKQILATNLATNRGLQDVREEIEHYLKKLPHIGSPLPKTWIRVREQLEKDPRNYISLEEYLSICSDNGFGETKDALQLSGYLHDIGVFLHFQDEPLLRKTVILKPKWGTDAVYKVVDNQAVIKNLGRFTLENLDRIWTAPEYESMRDELLQLMMKFKLCYEIPTQRGTYIAPQLLTENQPDYPWNEKDNLLLRYSYQFMPKGILTQFIVVMHPYIREQRIVWKSGVVIAKDDTSAEVIEYYGKREIHVRVAGPQARDLLTIIRHELKQIHDTYKRLKYDELIQCNCPACRYSQEPHFYTVAELLDFRANDQLEIQCRKKPYHMVNVMGLLGDVMDLSKLSEREPHPSVFVQGDYVAGDKTMADKNISISGSTVHGSVVAAESIKDSFNTINNSNAGDDLKDTLTQLAKAVEAMAKELPEEKAEEAADDMKRLAEEATKEKPSPRWYNVSIEGLIAAAQNLGEIGDDVIKLAEKVMKILTAGL